jgi:hypothetical protein
MTFEGHGERVTSVTFSPDGKRIVSTSADSTIRIWDAQTGFELLTLARPGDWIHDVAFAPGGDRLVALAPTTMICVWEASEDEHMPIADTLDARAHEKLIGIVEAPETYEVRVPDKGLMASILVDVNSEVKVGQALGVFSNLYNKRKKSILSPINGRVVKVNVMTDEIVGAGKCIIALAPEDPGEIVTWVSQKHALRLRNRVARCAPEGVMGVVFRDVSTLSGFDKRQRLRDVLELFDKGSQIERGFTSLKSIGTGMEKVPQGLREHLKQVESGVPIFMSIPSTMSDRRGMNLQPGDVVIIQGI